MKRFFIPAILLSAMTLSACSTFDKYANARFYEIYQRDGLSACDYKPKFSDCAEKMDFDIKISDDKNKIALAKYINHNDDVSYFGFTRDNYAEQSQPIRDFLAWEKQATSQGKHVVMKRPAGNTAGYLFESSLVDYTFDFVHTRADIPMLVIHVGQSTRYYGFTVEEARTLLKTLDAWYGNTFTGIKIT